MTPPAHLEVDLREGRRRLTVETIESIASLLRRADLPLNTRCGQRGLCDGCEIELLDGCLYHDSSGRSCIARGEPVVLRACEHRLGASGAAAIRIPPRSRLALELRGITDFSIHVSRAHRPLGSGLGVAIDVGTTTVALLLVDLTNGRIPARAAGANRQLARGDNVLTRINLCMTDPRMITRLQHEITAKTIRPLLTKALTDAGARADDVTCVTVAGNATMLHLMAGVDPSSMGVAPFKPTFVDHRALPFAECDFGLGPCVDGDRRRIHLLPGAAAYVGADICAGLVATGLIYDEGPALLVDVGTNGEIVLKHGNRLTACATAAGPAFEGVGLSCGARAGNGVISHVRITRNPIDVRTEVIGNDPPIGLCGSAFIDVLAHARRVGLLSPKGRLEPARRSEASGHIVTGPDGGRALKLARGRANRDILVTEADIAKLLPAKAAVAAGILTLLDRANLSPNDVETVYLAGGFGMHLDPRSAVGCGLLPRLDSSRVRPVGNAALAGAYLALLDAGILEEMSRLGPRIEIVELNLDPGFEARYIEQLVLPP